jgi:ABC-type nitrate/sulfonate/bicarbonate transport system substrate-binding protein
MKQLFFRLLLTALVVMVWSREVFPQSSGKNLKIAYSALSGSSFPIWIAKDGRLFEKYGLSADLIYIPSSSLALQAMLGGNIHIIPTASAPTIMQARLQGADTVLIGATNNTVTFFFMVTPDVTKPQDLKGKKVGVSRFGSSSDTAVRYALKKWGLEAGRDVTILQMGGIPEILAGMKSGSVSGGPFRRQQICGLARKASRNWSISARSASITRRRLSLFPKVTCSASEMKFEIL